MSDRQITIVFPIFARVTQLDFTGPHQVLARLPGARVLLASVKGGAVSSDDGITFADTMALADIPVCDILCVPGGPGVNAVLEDAAYLQELRRLAHGANWITSVCTGSLALGAAGLLVGKRAACHWSARDYLPAFGAIPDSARVVRDGNVMTGGGVTAGIDFALTLVAAIAGDEIAQAIQLGIDYAPAPPFDAGTPEKATPAVLARVRHATARQTAEREAVIRRITGLVPA